MGDQPSSLSRLHYSELVRYLRQHSYRESAEPLASGDVTVRGDTVLWWPVTETSPYRASFFGEDLERLERRHGEAWQAASDIPDLQPNELPTEHGTIRPGDYIVHPYHGVGIFELIVTREAGRFVSLQYAANDRLLFPFDKRAELMPYIGARSPRLTRLYSKVWQHTKERVQKNLIGVARELLKIYAGRQRAVRPAIRANPEWERAVRDSAGFQLTEDQERAVGEIMADLTAGEHPMDRLICGDVGFGKTEVALHAIAQVVQSGRQVAFVAPTTVLAEQHYLGAVRRLADLPIRVAHLSRLTGGAKELLEGVAGGEVDVLIGTHRVLSDTVRFKDLGLLIVDEEQKFGVAQKERLKEKRPEVDTLSMSATPIPRTLSMSLSGLRGLSLLRTPPQGRKPVQTIIEPFQTRLVRQALVEELGRGGQAYVVYNRVQSLGLVRQRIVKELQSAGLQPREYGEEGDGPSVAIAHGQMDEARLESVMSAFLRGEIDVLIASSIVEHGLDSPQANTLIVLHSEWFGLSDLYQLRGRVGRRQLQASAYFLIGGFEQDEVELPPEGMRLTEVARQRLLALKEADELGSGWSIALRDLEIRGGGNLLGHEQHGSMEAIGLLLYAQLLQEEIGRQAKRLGVTMFQRAPVALD